MYCFWDQEKRTFTLYRGYGGKPPTLNDIYKKYFQHVSKRAVILHTPLYKENYLRIWVGNPYIAKSILSFLKDPNAPATILLSRQDKEIKKERLQKILQKYASGCYNVFKDLTNRDLVLVPSIQGKIFFTPFHQKFPKAVNLLEKLIKKYGHHIIMIGPVKTYYGSIYLGTFPLSLMTCSQKTDLNVIYRSFLELTQLQRLLVDSLNIKELYDFNHLYIPKPYVFKKKEVVSQVCKIFHFFLEHGICSEFIDKIYGYDKEDKYPLRSFINKKNLFDANKDDFIDLSFLGYLSEKDQVIKSVVAKVPDWSNAEKTMNVATIQLDKPQLETIAKEKFKVAAPDEKKQNQYQQQYQNLHQEELDFYQEFSFSR